MAAIQSIRKRGGILIAIIGLALFAFIAEEFFRSFQTTSNQNRQEVGSVFGQTLNIQDFQAEVEERSEVAKLQKQMNGRGETLTEQEQDQIRETVWQEFVTNTVIEHEASKLGLIVTDEDVQNTLRTGQSPSLQLLAQLGFGNQQTGQFDVAALQDFLKNYDKSMQQLQQAGQVQNMEQFAQIRKLWDYTEKQLRHEILQQKYATLFSQGFLSNPVSAKYDFDAQSQRVTAEVAAVPYSSVPDGDVKVDDADVKAMYNNYKALFRNTAKSAALKVLDITVTPSDADREKLLSEVQGWQKQLEDGEDAAAVVGSSKTVYTYTNLAQSKRSFRQMPDVTAALDSLAVGGVKPAYYNAQDNTVTTLKLVAKEQAADSVLYRRIVAIAQTPEESAQRADSIFNALKGGATFADMATKYGQRSDSVWMFSSQYEGQGLGEEDAKIIAELNRMEPGLRVLSTTSGSLVVQVLERRHIETKYNVALVKCPLNFSKETYNAALNKLNRFLADNRTLADIEKNAGKAGYILNDAPNYLQSNLALQENIGGSGAKDAMRWVFDDAKAGEISKLYECGRNNDHLLVIGVKAINDGDYLTLDNEDVKKEMTALALRAKKAEKVLAAAKDVKDLAAAKALKGAVSDTLVAQTFLQPAVVPAVGVAEPKLAGAIAATEAGKFTGAVQGAAALYFAQVTAVAPSTEKFDEKVVMEQSAAAAGQMAMRTLISGLLEKTKVKDNRYRF